MAAPGRLLNEPPHASSTRTRVALAAWKDNYNVVRPHSALANLTPIGYTIAAFSNRNAAERYARSPHPPDCNVSGRAAYVAPASPMGSNEHRNSTHRRMKE
jgi:hypothetical protein